MVLAQEEARLLGHNFIGTEHLLLGLIKEGDGIAARALTSLGVTIESVRNQLEEKIPPGEHHDGSPPFTPVAKKALEMSLREALQLGHNYIGTEHIILGVLRADDSVATAILEQLGVTPAAVREAVISSISPAPGAGPLGAPRPARRFLSRGREPPIPQAHTRRPSQGQYRVSGVVDVALSGGRLTGVVAGLPVDVGLDIPASGGTCRGTFAGADLSCSWRLAPNGQWIPDVPGWARGVYAGEQGELRGWFHLSDDGLFEQATIEGEFAAETIAAMVRAGLASTPQDAFRINGYFAGAGFSLTCSFATGSAQLRGSIDGNPINLEGKRHQTNVDPRLRTVTGTFEGPSPLLFVATCALLFFI